MLLTKNDFLWARLEPGVERKPGSPAGQLGSEAAAKQITKHPKLSGFLNRKFTCGGDVKPYFLPVMLRRSSLPCSKSPWRPSGTDRAKKEMPPSTTQSSGTTPNCLYFKLCELGQMLMRLWHCGSPILSTEDSSSPSNSHLRLWDICLLLLADKQPGAGWVPFQFSAPTSGLGYQEAMNTCLLN